ncbi:MAG: hypothetical protein E4H27_07425 [Anaerolineales bacterium]|nr:MAG: hypothetical protein E4H27_07425 [Anaerolineales bacterium]
MAYPCFNEPRIGYLSNPTVIYPPTGQALGTAATEDIARLHNERIDGVVDPMGRGALAGFRTTPATMTLSGETIGNNESRMALASSQITISAGFTVESGGRFSAIINSSPFMKRSTKPSREEVEKPVGKLPSKTLFSVKAIFNMLNINYSLSESAPVIVSLFDINGALRGRISLGVKDAGNYNENHMFPIQINGIYYLEVQAGKYHQKQKLLVLK